MKEKLDNSKANMDIINQIECFLNCKTLNLTLSFADVCKQNGACDCGVYACLLMQSARVKIQS